MCDPKEHANAEGEMLMGTTRADGSRCLDEEAWEQYYKAATAARRGSYQLWMNEEQECWRTAKRTARRDTRNMRPLRQVEPAQTVEWERRNAGGLFSHDSKSTRPLVAILEPS